MPFTLIFAGDLSAHRSDPFTTITPYGIPDAIGVGNALERNEELADRIDRLEKALIEARRRLEKTRATWNAPCYECDAILTKALNETSPVLGRIQHALVVEGTAYPIEKRLAGSIEEVKATSEGYSIKGWAVDIKANGPVKFVFASVGPTIVAKTIPTQERADIRQGVAPGADPAGFVMGIPIVEAKPTKEVPIRVFAVMADGSAAQLASTFSTATEAAFVDAPLDPWKEGA